MLHNAISLASIKKAQLRKATFMEKSQEFITFPSSENLNDEMNLDRAKARTGLRMKYEAQLSVIRGQIGEISEIKQKLDLNSRGLAQLLLVDPSAVTRWTRDGGEAPPTVYRALQWYLALQEKVPGLTPQYFIGRDGRVDMAKNRLESEALERRFQTEVGELRRSLEKEKKKLKWIVAGMMVVQVLILTFFFVIFTL